MKKVLVVLAIVGMFITPMMPIKSVDVTENETKYDEINLFVPIAEYSVGGNCDIVIEILSEKIYKIYRIEIELKGIENNFEKRIINEIKTPTHFYLNGEDCVDLSFVDFDEDFSIADGNVVTIHLTNVGGDFVKVKLYTDNGMIYKEIFLKPAPRVEVEKSIFPTDTTCVITYPDNYMMTIEEECGGVRVNYFSIGEPSVKVEKNLFSNIYTR